MGNWLARLRNPRLDEEAMWDDSQPAPGGVEGQKVDWERWYPPDTPFKWGQGFPTNFTNVPAIMGGRWPNEFLPDQFWTMPYGVDLAAHMWPGAVGSDGRFQAQLNGNGTAKPTAGTPTATVMYQYGQALANLPAASLAALAGGFGRS